MSEMNEKQNTENNTEQQRLGSPAPDLEIRNTTGKPTFATNTTAKILSAEMRQYEIKEDKNSAVKYKPVSLSIQFEVSPERGDKIITYESYGGGRINLGPSGEPVSLWIGGKSYLGAVKKLLEDNHGSISKSSDFIRLLQGRSVKIKTETFKVSGVDYTKNQIKALM